MKWKKQNRWKKSWW